jgi:putative membrane protein
LKLPLILLACVTAIVPQVSLAANPAPAADAAISAPDRKFMTDAKLDGDLSIALSQLALQRAANDAVKQVAQKMIADQTTATKQLSQIAMLNGITFPASDDAAAKEAQQLQKLNGAAFDKLYAKLEAKHENDLMKLFHQEEHGGQNKQLARFAGDTLPIYEEDSDKAEHLMTAVAKTR